MECEVIVIITEKVHLYPFLYDYLKKKKREGSSNPIFKNKKESCRVCAS